MEEKYMYPVDEIFLTIQGEGRLQGIPSILIRFNGCNLKCQWCDTNLNNYDTQYLSGSDIIKQIDKLKCNNLVITGGEPLIQPHIEVLTQMLKKNNYHLTVETNATIQRNICCDLISMSPKLSHSIINDTESVNKININVIKYYIENYDYQLKFVVRDCEKDFEEVINILNEIEVYDSFKALIMPLSKDRKELFEVQNGVINRCIKYGFTYANRLQLQVWDGKCETI